jgi:hypothetical protein
LNDDAFDVLDEESREEVDEEEEEGEVAIASFIRAPDSRFVRRSTGGFVMFSIEFILDTL